MTVVVRLSAAIRRLLRSAARGCAAAVCALAPAAISAFLATGSAFVSLDSLAQEEPMASVNLSFYHPECNRGATGIRYEDFPCPHAPGGSATIQALDSGDRVPVGTMVTLIARPDDGFYVEGWNHAACLATGDWQNAGAEKRCVLSAIGDLNVTVTFALFSANGRSAHIRRSQVIFSYEGFGNTTDGRNIAARREHILINNGLLEDLGIVSRPPVADATTQREQEVAGIRMTLLGVRRGLQVMRMFDLVMVAQNAAEASFSLISHAPLPLWSHLATVGVAAAVCDELSDGWRIPSLSELAGMYTDASGPIVLDRAAGNQELDQAVAGARSGMIIPLGRDVAAGDFAALSEGSTAYETASRNLDGVYKAARPVAASGAIRFPGAAGDRRMLCVRGEIAEGAHYMSAVRLESGGEIIGSPAATLRAQTVAFTVTTTLSATQLGGANVFTGTVVSWRHKDAPEAMSNADAGVPSARTAGDWGGFALNSSPSADGTGLQIQVRAPSTRPSPTGENAADLIRLSARLNPGVGATVTAVFMVKVESPSVPAAPGSVVAALNADESASLSWTPPAETGITIIGYDILREQNGSSVYVSVGFSPGTGTIHTDASPPPLATLRYKTRARSAAGFGPASEASNPVETPQFFRTVNYAEIPQNQSGGTLTASVAPGGATLRGATVTFTATPAAGWRVEEWTGDAAARCAASGGACALTADANLFVTVRFVANQILASLRYGAVPPEGGTVTVVGLTGDIAAGGATVTFLATPAAGWFVESWNRADCANAGAAASPGEEKKCVLTATADLLVTAAFAIARTVTYDSSPENGALLAALADGTALESPGHVADGATVTFTAVPDGGFYVLEWRGDCAGPGEAGEPSDLSPLREDGARRRCALAADADLRASVVFARGRTLVFEEFPENGGLAAQLPDGTPLLPSGGVADGATVTFIATPEAGHYVSGWESGRAGGCESGFSNPALDGAKRACAVTVTLDILEANAPAPVIQEVPGSAECRGAGWFSEALFGGDQCDIKADNREEEDGAADSCYLRNPAADAPVCSDVFGAGFDFPQAPDPLPADEADRPTYVYNCDPDGSRSLVPATINTIGATECACAAGTSEIGGICIPGAATVAAQKCLDASRALSAADGGGCAAAVTLAGGGLFDKCYLSGALPPQCADVFGAELNFPAASAEGPFIYNCDPVGSDTKLIPATLNTVEATACMCPAGEECMCPAGEGVRADRTCGVCPGGEGALADGTCGACPDEEGILADGTCGDCPTGQKPANDQYCKPDFITACEDADYDGVALGVNGKWCYINLMNVSSGTTANACYTADPMNPGLYFFGDKLQCYEAFGPDVFPPKPDPAASLENSPTYVYNCDPTGNKGLVPATVNTIAATECACPAGTSRIGGICISNAATVVAQSCRDANRQLSALDGGNCAVAITTTLSGGTLYSRCYFSGESAPQCGDVFGADFAFPAASVEGPFVYNCDPAESAGLLPATANTVGATECACPAGEVVKGGGVCAVATDQEKCENAGWAYSADDGGTCRIPLRAPVDQTMSAECYFSGSASPQCAEVFGAPVTRFPAPVTSTIGATLSFVYNCDPDGANGLIPATLNTVGATACMCPAGAECACPPGEGLGADGTCGACPDGESELDNGTCGECPAEDEVVGGFCLPGGIVKQCEDAGWSVSTENGVSCGVPVTLAGEAASDGCYLTGSAWPQCAEVFGSTVHYFPDPAHAADGATLRFVYNCDPDGDRGGMIPASVNTIMATECGCASETSHLRPGACVPEKDASPEFDGIAQEALCGAFGGTVQAAAGGSRVCSGMDSNDTFCIIDSDLGFPCRGLFKHLRSCNLEFNRPALNPFFCGETCEESEEAVGPDCR